MANKEKRQRVNAGHEVKAITIGAIAHQPRDSLVHKHASRGTTTRNDAEGGAQDLFGSDINDEGGEIAQPRGERIRDHHAYHDDSL